VKTGAELWNICQQLFSQLVVSVQRLT